MTSGIFGNDVLLREQFVQKLRSLIEVISSAPALPAGRVIAVDAPWGSGKTWIASKLPGHLSPPTAGKCVYVNAYEFDFHPDPFPVIASAILKGCEDRTEATRELRKAAAAVLKSSAPAFAKGLDKVGAQAVGIDIDSVVDAVGDVSAKATEKALNKALATFEDATSSSRIFKEKLRALAQAQDGALVLVIDELDRCRPDFALSLLERIKHLFDVERVVFVLFAHVPALHAAIRRTYGEVDAAEYLRKFVSVTIELPVAESWEADERARMRFLWKFLEVEAAPVKDAVGHDFVYGLAIFAPYFNATLRDLQNALLLARVFARIASNTEHELAYVLLLRLRDPDNYAGIAKRETEAFAREIKRLGTRNDTEHQAVGAMRNTFRYLADPAAYREAAADVAQRLTPPHTCEQAAGWLLRAQAQLRVEYLQF